MIGVFFTIVFIFLRSLLNRFNVKIKVVFSSGIWIDSAFVYFTLPRVFPHMPSGFDEYDRSDSKCSVIVYFSIKEDISVIDLKFGNSIVSL